MRHGSIRASDADREQAAGRLRDHAVAGRLTVEELDERSGRALAARTLGELDALFQDLPRARRDIAMAPRGSVAMTAGLLLAQGVLWTVVGIAVLTIAVLCIVVRASLKLARLAALAAERRPLAGRPAPALRRGT
jgi:hypothetical protein